jgi:hypothetical protein
LSYINEAASTQFSHNWQLIYIFVCLFSFFRLFIFFFLYFFFYFFLSFFFLTFYLCIFFLILFLSPSSVSSIFFVSFLSYFYLIFLLYFLSFHVGGWSPCSHVRRVLSCAADKLAARLIIGWIRCIFYSYTCYGASFTKQQHMLVPVKFRGRQSSR